MIAHGKQPVCCALLDSVPGQGAPPGGWFPDSCLGALSAQCPQAQTGGRGGRTSQRGSHRPRGKGSASQPQRKGSPRCLTFSQRRCLDQSGLDLLCFPGSVLGTVGGVAYGEAGRGSTRDLLGPELTPSSGWCTSERSRWRMKCDFENLESSKT